MALFKNASCSSGIMFSFLEKLIILIADIKQLIFFKMAYRSETTLDPLRDLFGDRRYSMKQSCVGRAVIFDNENFDEEGIYTGYTYF